MRLISGERLRNAIARKGLSYGQFAEQVPCSKAMVGFLCKEDRRTCTPELAEKIARRLEVDLDYLFVPSVSLDKGENVPSRKRAAA